MQTKITRGTNINYKACKNAVMNYFLALIFSKRTLAFSAYVHVVIVEIKQLISWDLKFRADFLLLRSVCNKQKLVQII